MKTHSRKVYVVYMAMVAACMLWLQLLDAFTLGDDMASRFVWREDESEPL